MTERCKICYRTAAEWETNTLDEHLANAHRDDPMSVKAVYAEAHDRLFDDDGVVDADVGGGDDDEAQTDDEADETADERTAPDLADTTYGKKWYVIGVGAPGTTSWTRYCSAAGRWTNATPTGRTSGRAASPATGC
ncbi:hypothetical protein [Halogeometricum sp. CBA1124]|uniref:hypothetical protein n=1 Tax=Halogeometricum sp. CBA1124 TaxID=2668071 RepID=UPI0018D23094|nr:hypothetical protein [Halogeometricum sp. CBA1124]